MEVGWVKTKNRVRLRSISDPPDLDLTWTWTWARQFSLLHSPFHSFAGKDETCGKEIFATQLTDTFIMIKNGNKNWDFDGITHISITEISAYDNLISLIGYNQVTRGDKFSQALSEITKKTCEIDRDMIKNRLNILRHHSNTGLFEFFGEDTASRGYKAIHAGSALYIIRCQASYLSHWFFLHL